MNDKMYKITVITRREKFKEFRDELLKIDVTGMTVTEVEGFGMQHGIKKLIPGIGKKVDMIPKIKVDIVVCEVPVDSVIEAAKKVLYTGEVGDGKIFVTEMERVVRIRTGDENREALL